MSRDLPTTPSLEHLRKQAKHRLTEIQRQNPNAQLADAQHAIARDHGFASWPKLKVHVESLPAPASTGVATTNPFAGTWLANVSKSRQHPLNPFRSATLHVDVAGDTVTIIDDVVDGDGRTERRESTLRADGNEHPSEGGNGYSFTAGWRSPRVLETVGRKDGAVIGRGTYEVAADGQTMTITNDEQLIVLDRMGGSAIPV
jgi:hypothetical protein